MLNQMERPDWPTYFMDIAFVVAERASCPVRQVGSVFVNPETKAILSSGFNGAPRGTMECGRACEIRIHGEGQSACRAVHSEVNAIYNSALNGIKLNHSYIFCTLSPCENCAKALIQVGIEQVTYAEESAYPQAFDWFREAGVRWAKLG